MKREREREGGGGGLLGEVTAHIYGLSLFVVLLRPLVASKFRPYVDRDGSGNFRYKYPQKYK